MLSTNDIYIYILVKNKFIVIVKLNLVRLNFSPFQRVLYFHLCLEVLASFA